MLSNSFHYVDIPRYSSLSTALQTHIKERGVCQVRSEGKGHSKLNDVVDLSKRYVTEFEVRIGVSLLCRYSNAIHLLHGLRD